MSLNSEISVYGVEDKLHFTHVKSPLYTYTFLYIAKFWKLSRGGMVDGSFGWNDVGVNDKSSEPEVNVSIRGCI